MASFLPRITTSRRGSLAAIAAGLLAHGIPSTLWAGSASPKVAARTRFGVNVAWLLLDDLWAQGDGDGTSKLESLGKHGIPFVRFAASGHTAGDWVRFEADPAGYWRRLDRLFAAAEHSGVGLVPSVLWHTVAIAFHCGEPMQAWADPASRTRVLAKRYVDTFVDRYDRSPALLMYEFSNELNVWVDLPQVLHFWPKHDDSKPDRKPLEGDRLTHTQLRAFSGDFARQIRDHGSDRPIGMGSSVQRSNAWHLARGHWETDTPEQFTEQFRSVTAPEFDVLSVHIYEDVYGQRGSAFATLPELLAAIVRTAALDGRKTFLGEFGVPRQPDRAEERRRFAAMMTAIRVSGIDYAALWNFAPRRFQPEFDVSFDNDRAYQLEALAEANAPN